MYIFLSTLLCGIERKNIIVGEGERRWKEYKNEKFLGYKSEIPTIYDVYIDDDADDDYDGLIKSISLSSDNK